MTRRRELVRALLVLGGILLLVYLPLAWGQIIFFRDASRWNFPARWLLQHAYASGEPSSWNPYQGLGLPTRANPLYAPFYPLHWLYALTPEAWVARVATWQTFAHLVAGSVGAALLARRLGAATTGTIVAGLAWGLSGWASSGWSAGVLLPSGAWVPWVALGALRMVRAGVAGMGLPRAIAAAAVPIALALLYGEIFVAMLACGFGAIAAVIALRCEPQRPRGATVRVAAAGVAAVAIAALVGAVVVLPARALSRGNERAAALPREIAEACSMHPLRLLEMVVPGSMGEPAGDYPGARVIGEPTIGGHPLFYDVYLGATVVALAVAALGRGRRVANALALAAGVALVVAMGRHTPLHQIVRTIVRPLAYMRYPEKYLVLVVTPLAVLAGLGATRLLDPQETRRRITAPLVVVAAVVAVVAAVAPWAFPPGWSRFIVSGAGHALVALVAVLGAALFASRRPRAAAALLVIAVAVDLATQAMPSLEFDDASVATRVPEAARAIVADAKTRGAAPPRVYRPDALQASVDRFDDAVGFAAAERRAVATLVPNTAMTFGVANVPGYDAAVPSALAQLWKGSLRRGLSVLRLLSVEYALLPADPGAPATGGGVVPLADPVAGARLVRVGNVLPRVYLAGRAEVLDDQRAWPRLFDESVLSGDTVLLAPTSGAPVLSGGGKRAGACHLDAFGASRVVATCRAERDGVAVFVEQHAPGWRASVDGAAVPLLRANLVMRAVAVPAGEHRIELTYAVPGAALAGALSLLGLIALLGLAVVPSRVARPQRA